MVTHTSILAWETPRTEEPGRLQSMVSQKRCTQLSDRDRKQDKYKKSYITFMCIKKVRIMKIK